MRYLLLTLLFGGCSFIDDFDEFREKATELDGAPGTGDAGPHDAGDVEAGEDAAAFCKGARAGRSCSGEGILCVDGSCRISICGDGYVDEARGEECEDRNLVEGDGCEPETCTYSCTKRADCDNHFLCDGQESCVGHRCESGAFVNDVECKRFDGQAGECAAGYCVPPGCGDGSPGAGEECDGQPGCRPDCTMGCDEDDDCPAENLCEGAPRCDTATGSCGLREAAPCKDGDPCTRDACAPSTGCTFIAVDGDGDGFAPGVCAAGSSVKGGDCDDTNKAAYPGATEYCDGVDNDCDDMRDESSVKATCYPDADGDGYPVKGRAISACTCPKETMPERSDHEWDCWDDPDDAGRDVFPGQTESFAVGYGAHCLEGASPCQVVTRFDFDCDGEELPLFTVGNVTSCGLLGGVLACSAPGYADDPPACGEAASYRTCAPNGGLLGGCAAATALRTQRCR